MYEQELKKLVIFLILIGYVESNIDGKLVESTIHRSLPKILAGDPSIGAEGLDPLRMVDLQLDCNGFKINYTNAVVYGLKDANVEYLNVDMGKKTIDIKLSKLDSYFRGDYVASGKILDIPISGHGELTVTSISMDLYGKIKFEIQCRNGKHFIITKDCGYHFVINDHVEFYFSNLYNGDEEKSCKTLKEINKRWTDIRDNYSKPFMDRALDAIYKSFTTYFCEYSIEDINGSADVQKSSCATATAAASAA